MEGQGWRWEDMPLMTLNIKLWRINKYSTSSTKISQNPQKD